MTGLLRTVAGLGTACAAAAGAVVGYAAIGERRRFRVRHETLPVLPAGARELRVLHLSDLHTVPGQRAKRDFVHSLRQLEPDLVVDTGDNLSHPQALPYLLEILEPLLELPGLYVPGSNCYFAPTLRNPARYLWTSSTADESMEDRLELPWRQMHEHFEHAGWHGAINRSLRVEVAGHVLNVSGVDDPHLGYDDHPGFLPAQHEDDLRLALAHAPYLRTLDRFAQDRADLVLAGHTHGGQVCLPGGRALVSNCDIEPERCKGMTSQHGVPVGISAGLGESRFARVRLFCPPEAVLMRLTPRG